MAKTRMWRMLAAGGLVIGVASLLRTPQALRSNALGRPQTPPSVPALESGYETLDVSVRAVTGILAGIAATTLVMVAIVFVMVWRFDIVRTRSFDALTPEQTAQVITPAPHLQVDAFADLAQQRAREQQLLTRYGWTSADHSVARIPLDRAMALTVGQSLDASP